MQDINISLKAKLLKEFPLTHKSFGLFYLCFSVLIFFSSSAYSLDEAYQSFTVSGTLYQNGTSTPLVDPNAKILIQILNPDKTCLLYEEQQTANVGDSGQFAIQVGSAKGTAKRTSTDPKHSMSTIFQNTNSIFAANPQGATCLGGFYAPKAGDVRYLRLTVTPSTSNIADTLNPDLAINSLPSALVAQSVQGLERSKILQSNNLNNLVLSQNNLEWLFQNPNFSNLQKLLSGQLITGDNNGVALPAVNPSSPTAGAIWYDSTSNTVKYYNGTSVLPLGGDGAGIATITVGPNLTANGIAGGQLTTAGSINLNSNLTNIVISGNSSINTTGTIATTSNISSNNISATGNISGSNITASGTISSSSISTNTVSTNNLSTTNLYSPIIYGGTSGSSNLTLESTTHTSKGNIQIAPNGGNVGIGVNSPSEKLEIKGNFRLDGMTSGYVGFAAPSTVTSSVIWTLPVSDGTTGQLLKTDGAGTLSWITPNAGNAGTVTSINTGNGLIGGPITSSGTISVNAGTGVNQIVQLDSSAKLPAIDGSLLKNINLANTSGSLNLSNTTGSLDLTNTFGTLPVAKGGTGLTTGISGGIPYYLSNNTIASSPTLSLNGIIYGGGAGGSPLSTAAMLDGQFLVGKTGSAPQVVFMGGDATISNTGSLTLASSGVAAGTYSKVIVDTKGRVISSAALGSSDITTALGYTPSTTGTIATGNGLLGGPITSNGTISVNAGTGVSQIVQLDGSAKLPSIDASLLKNLTGASAGTYGSTSQVPQITVDTTGRITNISTTTITALTTVTGSTLTSANMWIGNGSNAATEVTMSGDATLSSSGTLTLASTGIAAGTYSKVTVDSKGRVTSSGTIDLSTADVTGVLPSNKGGSQWTTSGTNIYYTNTATGNVGIGVNSPSEKLEVKGNFRLDGMTSGYVGFAAPSTVTSSVIWTLPVSDGTTGQLLKTDGAGTLSWITPNAGNAGTVTSINTGNGLIGGPITSSGTISVNAGTGVSQIVQLDSSAKLPAVDGSQLTNINLANTSGSLNLSNTTGSLDLTNTFGTLPVAKGGTGLTAGTSGGIPYYLSNNTIASSPVLSLNGIIYGGGAGGAPLSTAAMLDGQFLVGKTGSAPQVVFMSGDATISNTGSLTLASTGVTPGTYTSVLVDEKGRVTSGTTIGGASQWTTSGTNIYFTTAGTGNVGIGVSSPAAKLEINGNLRLDGATSGYVGFVAPATVTSSVIWTLPVSDGTNGQILKTNGAGTLSWVTGSATGVTSITAGNGLLGGTITTNGTFSVNAGTGVSQIVQLDGSAKLPAVDGSQLTNINLASTTGSLNLANTSGTLPVTKGGTGLTAGTSGGIPYYNANNTMASSPILTLNGIIYGGGAGGSPLSTSALLDGQIIVGKTGGFAPQVVTMGGDATISNSGTLTLANSGVTAGTYTQVVVDAKGRVTSGTTANGGASQWVTSGTNIYYTSAATGNVGIGNSSPTQKLDVSGSINITSGNAYKYSGNNVISAITANGDFFFGPSGNLTMTGRENVAIGDSALVATTTGSYNTAAGYQALNANTTASYNTAFGEYTLALNTTGIYNTAIGGEVLYATTSGSYNTGVGLGALNNNSTGSHNTAIGKDASGNNTTGSYNSAMGRSALWNISTGSYNTGLGYGAGGMMTTGNYNVIIGGNDGTSIAALSNFILLSDGAGNERMRINSSGNMGIGTTSPTQKLDIKGNINISAGSAYMYDNTNVITAQTALYNYYFGPAGVLTTTGSYNLGIGKNALSVNTSGNANVALGDSSLKSNSTGINNTAAGKDSLRLNTSGNWNSAFGFGAMYNNTTGSYNTAVGESALYSNTTGQSNTGVGESALGSNTTGYSNTAVGIWSLTVNSTGSGNTAMGDNALSNNSTAKDNTGIGMHSLATTTTGSYNTGVGAWSLNDNTLGNNNIAIGRYALGMNSTGSFNTALGNNALYGSSGVTTGSYNIGIGYNSGGDITSGAYNVILGSNAGTSIATLSNFILISDGAGNERMRINNSGNIGIATTAPSARLDVNQTTAGSIAIQAQNAGTVFWKVANPAGGATNSWNAANAIQYIGKDTGTNRSINAAGTVNASGADFAEWADWNENGPKPEMGSVILYKGSYVVVSSPFTAAFIGNDIKDSKNAILVAFAGQLPVLIRGIVHEGDLIIANEDGTARAVAKSEVTLTLAQKAVGTAWASSTDPGLKRVNVAVGIGLSNGGSRDISSIKAENAQLKQENAKIKARLEQIEKALNIK